MEAGHGGQVAGEQRVLHRRQVVLPQWGASPRPLPVVRRSRGPLHASPFWRAGCPSAAMAVGSLQRSRPWWRSNRRRRLPTCDAEYPKGEGRSPLSPSAVIYHLRYRNAMAIIDSHHQGRRALSQGVLLQMRTCKRPSIHMVPWVKADHAAMAATRHLNLGVTCIVSPWFGGRQIQTR